MLTNEKGHEMKESLTCYYFDMSMDEFTEAWKACEFDGDRFELAGH